MKRALILVLDSFGIGATADADRFGDSGSDTLGHIAQQFAAEVGRPLRLPNLAKLGLFEAHKNSSGSYAEGHTPLAASELHGAWGHAAELSSGKDTPSGHWEMAGVPVLFDWGYFTDKTDSFPPELLDELIRRAELPGVLGNCHASGTQVLDDLGEEHMASGKPIVYTSADSVFQIAAHEESFGLERLLELCVLAREILEPYNIGRVIARPFVGDKAGSFARTGNRRDYSVLPPAPTLLDKLAAAGGEVVSVGKIADIFAQQGITRKVKATGLEALFDTTLAEYRRLRETAGQGAEQSGLLFTNFVDFDSSFGHRRDVVGYGDALEYFDRRLPELLAELNEDDLLLLTADHGCDPTWHGTDHTREHVPVLIYGKGMKGGDLGLRDSFADMGQTLADYFDLSPLDYGQSFLPALKNS